MSRLGVPFEVFPAGIGEQAGDCERPERVARRLARGKALAVARLRPDAFVIGADTVVACGGRLLGKPADVESAAEMLGLLRGRTHRVVTALAIVPPGARRPVLSHALTRVVMCEYGGDQILASIARGDPFDKAGGYAIQDEVFRPVASWDGCYCNVVGLPLWRAAALLKTAKFSGAARVLTPLPACALCPDRVLNRRVIPPVESTAPAGLRSVNTPLNVANHD